MNFSTIDSQFVSDVAAEIETLRGRSMPPIPSLNTPKNYGTSKQQGAALVRRGLIWMFFLLVPLGMRYLTRGRELLADDVYEATKKDRRRPVVYLRSFAADKQRSETFVDLINSATSGLFYRPSIELKIFQGLNGNFKRKFGPYIGIAQPAEFPPCLGTSKCYVENADWKKALLWMLEQSQLAVVRIGQGDGIFWELAAAFLLYPRDRILLVIDPNSVSDKQLADTYSNLSANLSATFELHFPERFNGSRVITFSKGGYATLHMAGVLTTLLTGNSFGMSIRKATKSIPEVTSFE
ncbi:MAG: hypothetical protein Q7U88_00765 [Desulfocapsaceae bacterium]|nr:hypothetical protein [Desulfocapsaceae bacterium]